MVIDGKARSPHVVPRLLDLLRFHECALGDCGVMQVVQYGTAALLWKERCHYLARGRGVKMNPGSKRAHHPQVAAGFLHIDKHAMSPAQDCDIGALVELVAQLARVRARDLHQVRPDANAVG